MVSRTNISRE